MLIHIEYIIKIGGMDIKLMIATNNACGNKILQGIYNELVWASDNMETVAHYYEGCVIELDVNFDRALQQDYVDSVGQLLEKDYALDSYKFGVRETYCPAKSTWYSISGKYLLECVITAKEIYPDLSKWQDDEDDNG